MAFSEIRFVFLFFPIAIALYTIAPGILKNWVLLALSVVFFAWGSPRYVVLMLLLILFNWFSGKVIAGKKADKDARGAKFALITAVAADLALLGFFKYWGFVLENINALLGTRLSAGSIPMPLGVSVFTFSILSYLFDVYRDKVEGPGTLPEFAVYVTFFPKLVSGPIVPYHAMTQQIRERKHTGVKFGHGCRLFLIGLAKKVLLSDMIGTTFYAVTALDPGAVSAGTAWLGAVTYSLMLYFDFGGYSDMALGLGEMLGFVFDKNFDYPYLSTSVSEFWRRWHISLGSWFKNYVYFPLGGSRVGTAKTIRNLMVVWLLTGIWHGASWNFIFWGVYYGGILIVEKFLLAKVLEKIPGFIRTFLTLFAVIFGWVFFFSPNLGFAFRWLYAMVGGNGLGFLDATAKYYLGGSWMLIVLGILGATRLPAYLGNSMLRPRSKVPVYLSVIWFAALLLMCVAGMMVSTYSSFLYFQF